MLNEDENKKIDPKKHKKNTQFLLYSFCHYILEIYNRLADKLGINFVVLMPLVNNYILNLFIICLANQINLDITKGLIDEAVIIVLDYISISHEDEFQKQNYNPKYNHAIHFSWQKIHTRIIQLINTNNTNITGTNNIGTNNTGTNNTGTNNTGTNTPSNSITSSTRTPTLLCTSPHSLPSSLSQISDSNLCFNENIVSGNLTTITKTLTKRKLPATGKASLISLLNYKSIIGNYTSNRTTRAIILSCEIITQIFNLFAVIYPLRLPESVYNHWLELFEPIHPDILGNDTHEDEVKYSNSVFFTQLTYNLDILECFINMLLPQLLKLSQSSKTNNIDIIFGQKIANNINQIYLNLSSSNYNNIPIPSFIYLMVIYNYLHSPFDIMADENNISIINQCCLLGVYLGYYSSPTIQQETNNTDTAANKYHLAIATLKTVLGIKTHQPFKLDTNEKKIINNRNLITAIITLNSNFTC